MSAVAFSILFFVLGVLLNAFFAGYETGFVASNPIRVRRLAEKELQPAALRLLAYIEQPDRMITLVLIGTNLALVMGTVAITRIEALDAWVATLIATPTFLIFGEVLPKSVFRIHPTRLALSLLPVVRFFDALLAPVVVPIAWLSRKLLKVAGGEQRDMQTFMTTLEDMRMLVDESAVHGTIEPEEQEMIHSVIDLHTRQAQEIMAPRIDIQALPETATRSELIALLIESGRTRIPIYRETIDDVIGVISAFDVLTDPHPESEDIKRFIKDILHVPDTMKLDDLLEAFKKHKSSMVIVTDEFGGTDGLIAIEDVLEEIFGEIHDEHDKEETQIRRVGRHAYVVETRTPLEEVSRFIETPIEDEEVETVGGWVMHATGRIPKQGEVISIGRFRVTVLSGGENHLSSIRLEVLPEGGKAEADAAKA